MVAKNLGMVLGDNFIWYIYPAGQRWLKDSRGESFEHPMHYVFHCLCHAFVCLHVRFVCLRESVYVSCLEIFHTHNYFIG